MANPFKHPKRHLKKLLRDGEYVQAITYGKNLESNYSEDHDFMFIMASVYFIVDDPAKALPYFEKALELDSTDIETLTLKTNVHLALEQKEQAIECCKQILLLRPKNTEAHDLLDKLEAI